MVPFKKTLVRNLRYTDLDERRMLAVAGTVFLLSFIPAFFAFQVLYLQFAAGLLVSLGAELFIIAFPQAVIQLLTLFRAEKRAAQVDAILPDALQLMSANVRSGMTVDRAIWLAARPEFGPLQDEIKRASTEVLGASTIQDALSGMTQRIKSKNLERAVKLIIEGLKGGGEIAKLLDNVASDMREFQAMIEQMRSNTAAYTIFIVLAAVIGAPILFGISTYFIEVTHSIFATRVLPQATALPTGAIRVTGPQVNPEDVRNFAIAAIATITLFASLIVGLIRTGDERNGLKYAPLLVGGALAVFFVVKFAVSSMFGAILVL